MDLDSKIYIAGHSGLVGSSILRKLKSEGYKNIVLHTHRDLNLCNQSETESFFRKEKPEYVFLAAAKVGGIWANSTYPAEFIYHNLAIQINVIHSAYLHGVKKLLFLGSSCIYPKFCPQPMREEYLLTGLLEPTNEPYAMAKIAGIKMCEAYNRQYGTNFISVMPTNLYGPGDNFDLETSHVLPALVRKFHEAKVQGNSKPMTIWGTGTPRREFLHVNDLADACVFLMNHFDIPPSTSNLQPLSSFINIGVGKDITIRELAELIGEIEDFKGEIIFDHSKPDGTPRKLLDVKRLEALGWKPKIGLREGLEETYKWYLKKVTSNL